MNKPRKRHWALTSAGAGAGKTTFLASNARPPLMVIDADGRFDASEPLVNGDVYYASQVIDTLALAEELIVEVPKKSVKSMSWDSITKVYSLPARLGFMRNRAGKMRTKSKAAEMIDKSNAMTLARDLVILGTDVYYCWHTTSGVDGLGKSEVRDMISGIEKDRLMTSVNVHLEFAKEDTGSFSVTVIYARDFGDRVANVGFKVFDQPGNFWRGGADLIEQMIYTPYTTKDEAIKWTAEELLLTIDEAEGVYDHAKETIYPESHGQMFALYLLYVRELVQNSSQKENRSESSESALPEKPPEREKIVVEHTVFAESRDSLVALGDPVNVGNVVFAVATAWPKKFSADQALLKLMEYPDVPEGTELRMDRSIKAETGLKMFDWLGEIEVESE